MLAGQYHELEVARISAHGLYLTDNNGEEVLLPNRYVSLDNKIGDTLRVFVFHDSEDRLTATTQHPYGTVGEVAYLKVVDKTVHGAFLDWGLEAKDLFLPNRNMSGRVEPDQKYIVYIYRDTKTGRAVATMELRDFISNAEMNLKRGREVDIIVARRTETGYRVVIENKFWGMLYDNQLFENIGIGDRMKAFVRKITEDNKVDLSLQQEGFNEVKTASDKLLDIIRKNGGQIALHDSSSPEEVMALTRMSKKVFKRSAGYLMKRGVVSMDDSGIKLMENDSETPKR